MPARWKHTEKCLTGVRKEQYVEAAEARARRAIAYWGKENQLVAQDLLRLAQMWREAEAEVARLRAAALDLVAEYRSHGGPRTHQECCPGCGCVLPAKVDALAQTIDPR